MQEIIQFLTENVEVVEKVKEGTASLVGVTGEEVKAILEVFFNEQIAPKVYIWE
ncbi:competence pheromone ComX [Sporosarcina sp. ACRSM]|uniref:competence pheromone ComX n=1 Tax=Sporosarcina sp. ACRSM TaxID=2918216 RepID=UPI001EF4329B|nr:competence pheromone ComX [Sporosarcina sp. ACRSM]MCG7336725.1 competence pheromone ComX [Sporosarcina sp. ACRSM]